MIEFGESDLVFPDFFNDIHSIDEQQLEPQLEIEITENKNTDINSNKNKSIKQKSKLKRVKNIVTNFRCEECGKYFAQKSALTLHSTLHTGEKKFGCQYCEKKFRIKGNMSTHMRQMHENPKPLRKRGSKKDKKEFIGEIIKKSSDTSAKLAYKIYKKYLTKKLEENRDYFETIDLTTEENQLNSPVNLVPEPLKMPFTEESESIIGMQEDNELAEIKSENKFNANLNNGVMPVMHFHQEIHKENSICPLIDNSLPIISDLALDIIPNISTEEINIIQDERGAQLETEPAISHIPTIITEESVKERQSDIIIMDESIKEPTQKIILLQQNLPADLQIQNKVKKCFQEYNNHIIIEADNADNLLTAHINSPDLETFSLNQTSSTNSPSSCSSNSSTINNDNHSLPFLEKKELNVDLWPEREENSFYLNSQINEISNEEISSTNSKKGIITDNHNNNIILTQNIETSEDFISQYQFFKSNMKVESSTNDALNNLQSQMQNEDEVDIFIKSLTPTLKRIFLKDPVICREVHFHIQKFINQVEDGVI